MTQNGNEKLKIKTVSGVENDEFVTFSPEEMHPIEVAEALESDLIEGKNDKQIKKARRIFGTNEIRSEFRLSFKESLRNQIKGLTSPFLLLCSLLMYLFQPQEYTYLFTTLIVGGIIIFNAFAEYRANLALRLPKKYSSLKAKVVRNGEETVIDSRQLVPGDLLVLEEGAMVPADCRLIDDLALSVLEYHVSNVKGSVAKSSRYLARDGSEAVCENMVYAGSIITSGHCSAIVCRTGKETLIRRMRANRETLTPDILKYVQELCRFISIASVLVCFVLLAVGVMAGADITKWFICSLAIGASSLCDSMVSLCAAALGFGSKKMTEDGMVVKNYNCIQTLASTDTIACGKNLAFPPRRIMLTGLYFSCRNYDREKRPDEAAVDLLKLMLVCSDARKITAAERKHKRGLPEYKGLPLDNAIVDYFGEWGKTIGPIREQFIKLDAEYTLSGDISRMLALHNGKNTVIVRGSPENILSRCAGYTLDGADYKLSDFTRKKILAATEDAARTNSFLVAIACGETEASNLRDIDAEQRLIFKGFISFSSSLDPGVAEAVYRCESAEIETILNSNDAYYTALNSAKNAGIISDEEQIITAEQIRSCDRGLFIANAPYYNLFLNIDDGEWLDIIKLRQENKRTVAATAERINELPIMSQADVSMVPESSCDTLRQTADAMLLGKGINLIADGILNAKTICRRIFSVVSYLPAAIIIMLVASVFSACYNQIPPFRAQDVLFGGILFNLVFACALAFEPRHIKNIRDKATFLRKSPSINDFIYPLMFAIGGGILLFVINAATLNYTCSMLSLTLLLFLFACSVGGHGGVLVTKRFGSRLLYLCGLGVAAFIALLIFTRLGQSLFGYAVPAVQSLVLSLVLTLGYFIFTQTARLFLSPNPKKKKSKGSFTEEEMAEEEQGSEEYDYDDGYYNEENYNGDEDYEYVDDYEDYEYEDDYEDYEKEKEINHTDERRNQND